MTNICDIGFETKPLLLNFIKGTPETFVDPKECPSQRGFISAEAMVCIQKCIQFTGLLNLIDLQCY